MNEFTFPKADEMSAMCLASPVAVYWSELHCNYSWKKEASRADVTMMFNSRRRKKSTTSTRRDNSQVSLLFLTQHFPGHTNEKFVIEGVERENNNEVIRKALEAGLVLRKVYRLGGKRALDKLKNY